ncbi:MAG TPA: hypothetical protein VLG38_05615 [Gammaproteobacteria bacterium]|nr:hypothetical protein [Gammaproteobacteria bacterium]
MGFDLDQQIMHPVNDFVNLTYPTRFGGEIYASYRMLGPLGFELGYHWTTDKGKNIVTVPGTVLFNTAATISTEYECKLRVEDTYLDAYWHYKIRKIAELKLGIGVGFVRENLRFYNPAGFTDPLGTALAAMTTNTTITARFNMGIQTMLTKRIGARALFGYQTTSSVKGTMVPGGANPHMFANSYMVSIGLYYTITGYYDDNPGPNGEFLN